MMNKNEKQTNRTIDIQKRKIKRAIETKINKETIQIRKSQRERKKKQSFKNKRKQDPKI